MKMTDIEFASLAEMLKEAYDVAVTHHDRTILETKHDQLVLRFESNDWRCHRGVSIIRSSFSYGGTEGLCEAVEVRFNNKDDMILVGEPQGWLNVGGIIRFINEVLAS